MSVSYTLHIVCPIKYNYKKMNRINNSIIALFLFKMK